MQIRVRYRKQSVWRFALPRKAVFEADGVELYEYSVISGDILDLKSGAFVRSAWTGGARVYRLPDGDTLSIKSHFMGNWSVEQDGSSEEIRETWPTPSRRQMGTDRFRFECDGCSDEIYAEVDCIGLDRVIVAFQSFTLAQPPD